MFKELKKLFLYASVALIVVFVLFAINQVAQITQLAYTIHPLAGIATLIALAALFIGLVAVPLISYYRLPAALIPPADQTSAEYDKYIKAISKRLNKNPYIKQAGFVVESEEDIEKAYALIDQKADLIIKNTASTIFLSTAVSQNGRLDALMVLIAQTKLVWQLTHLYNQRPTLKYMVKLYGNIAATTLIVSELDDMNLAKYIEPGLSTLLGTSVLKMVPGAQVGAQIITNSIIEGTANAFLTLRVGVITKRYATALKLEEKWSIRKSASLEAAKMLGSIAVKCANMISTSVIEATKSLSVGTVKSGGNMIFDAGKKTFDLFKNIGDKILTEVGVETNEPNLIPEGHSM